MRREYSRRRVWRRLGPGLAGAVFVLSGCDPQTRTTIPGRLNTAGTGLSTTFIDALSRKLQSDSNT